MTRDEIIRLAREAGFGLIDDDLIDYFERFAALVAAAEREACMADVLAYGGIHIYDASKIVETIRAREQG